MKHIQVDDVIENLFIPPFRSEVWKLKPEVCGDNLDRALDNGGLYASVILSPDLWSQLWRSCCLDWIVTLSFREGALW